MTLNELIVAVKEKNLTKEQIEAYGDQMSSLFAEMMLETAELEKKEALFMGGDYVKLLAPEIKDTPSVAERKVMWKATKNGQRLIVLKRYCVATKEMINSLKSRVYRLIY